MELENRILSREISRLLYEKGKSVGTAESCTGGRIAEAIISTPGASIEEQTAVCEEVARQMVKGACHILDVDFAVSATGYAGPGGGTKDIPVGTIWLACGTPDEIVTFKLEEDDGRDKNLEHATKKAMQMFYDFLNKHIPVVEEEG